MEIPGLKAISLQDRDDYPFAQDRLAASFEWVDYSDPVPLYAPGMPFEAYDFQERYLWAVFAFIGVEDFEILGAEGLAFGTEQREPAVRAALAAVPLAV